MVVVGGVGCLIRARGAFVRALQRNAQVCLGLSRANQLRLDSRLLLNSPSQFPSLPAGTGVPANGTRGRKELPVTACLATSNACQTKSRAVRGRGATIPRPSFTNYAEYLLTGGLSLRLLSRPPPQHPITSSPARLRAYRGLRRGSCSSARLEVRAAETKGRELERRGGEAKSWGLGFDLGNISEGMMKRLSEFR